MDVIKEQNIDLLISDFTFEDGTGLALLTSSKHAA